MTILPYRRTNLAVLLAATILQVMALPEEHAAASDQSSLVGNAAVAAADYLINERSSGRLWKLTQAPKITVSGTTDHAFLAYIDETAKGLGQILGPQSESNSGSPNTPEIEIRIDPTNTIVSTPATNPLTAIYKHARCSIEQAATSGHMQISITLIAGDTYGAETCVLRGFLKEYGLRGSGNPLLDLSLSEFGSALVPTKKSRLMLRLLYEVRMEVGDSWEEVREKAFAHFTENPDIYADIIDAAPAGAADEHSVVWAKALDDAAVAYFAGRLVDCAASLGSAIVAAKDEKSESRQALAMLLLASVRFRSLDVASAISFVQSAQKLVAGGAIVGDENELRLSLLNAEILAFLGRTPNEQDLIWQRKMQEDPERYGELLIAQSHYVAGQILLTQNKNKEALAQSNAALDTISKRSRPPNPNIWPILANLATANSLLHEPEAARQAADMASALMVASSLSDSRQTTAMGLALVEAFLELGLTEKAKYSLHFLLSKGASRLARIPETDRRLALVRQKLGM